MMRRASLLTGLIATMIAVPSIAFAQDAGYVDPYEAFYQSMENGYAPVKARYVDQLIQRRDQRTAEEKQATHTAAPTFQDPTDGTTTDTGAADAGTTDVTTDTTVDTSAADTGDTTIDTGTSDSTFSLTPAEMRRVLRERELAGQNPTNPWGQNATHEGAPLPITGMESNVAAAVMLAALGYTLWKARSAVTL